MRVTLTIPPYSFKETYPKFMFRSKKIGGGYGAIPGATAPLGTLYIASVLREEGHKISFIDGVFYPDENRWLEEIEKTKPEFIGFNSPTILWKKTKYLSKKLKERISGVKIGVAGSHVTGVGPKALKEENTNAIDFLFLGESEYAVRDFLNYLENETLSKADTDLPSWDLADIWKVVTVCWKEKSKIRMLKKTKPPQNLDELPLPARDISPMKRYCPSIGFYKRKPHATMWTSRGCPFNCTFCTSKRIYRERNLNLVLDEIKELVERYKVRDIFFYDNNIALKRKRIEKLCKLLIEENLDIVWSAQSRLHTINLKILRLMKKAGCWRICYGIETPSKKSLQKIKKKINIDLTKTKIKQTREAGIEVFGAFVLGVPGETIEDIKKTINYAYTLPLDYAKFNLFTPFPDSRCKITSSEGKIISNKMTHHHPVFISKGLTKEKMEEIFREAYLKFYSNPRYWLRRIKKIKSIEDIKRTFRGSIAFLTKIKS